MHPEKLRQILKIWFSEQLRIDVWTPNLPKAILNPSRPPSVGISDPATELNVGTDPDISNPKASCSITYQLVYRFHADTKYDELGIGKAERLLLSILHNLQLAPMRKMHKDIISIMASGDVLATKPSQQNTFWAIVFEIRTTTIFDAYVQDLAVEAPEFRP